MTERKRAEAVALTHGGASASFCDFEAPGSGANSPSQRAGDALLSTSGSPRSIFAARRTSIVEGLSQHDLLAHHRRSLAGLQPIEKTADQGPSLELEGVTLSRRHTYTEREYAEGQKEEVFAQLDDFKCGFDDGPDDAAPPDVDVEDDE
jgi:hypothetical protein